MLDTPVIAVAGATSKQGRSVVRSLLRGGDYRVRAMTRDPASQMAKSLERQGAELVTGSLSLGSDDEWVDAFSGARAAFLVTPPTPPKGSCEYELGCRIADAAVRAGVEHIVFSTLENVDKITGGRMFAPHFTDKARVADYISGLPVASTFVILSFFYTNLMEYYVPRVESGSLILPIYLPEDFRAPFVDPVTATGPAVREIISKPEKYDGETLPVVGDIVSPREMVRIFQDVTGLRGNIAMRSRMMGWRVTFLSWLLMIFMRRRSWGWSTMLLNAVIFDRIAIWNGVAASTRKRSRGSSSSVSRAGVENRVLMGCDHNIFQRGDV